MIGGDIPKQTEELESLSLPEIKHASIRNRYFHNPIMQLVPIKTILETSGLMKGISIR
jgi:hypothetical protein